MAKMLGGAMGSTKSKGSIAGTTMQGSRYGQIIRGKPRPVRRARTVQPKRRATLGFLSRYFSSEITSTEKVLWQNYANAHPRTDNWGQSYVLSAIQQFEALMIQAMRLGGVSALYDSPPIVVPAATLATLEASNGVAAGDIKLDWTVAGVGSADDFIEVWVSPGNMGKNRSFEIQAMKFSASVAGNITTKTIEGLIVGMKYWLKARYVDEFGQVTAWMNVQWEAPAVA